MLGSLSIVTAELSQVEGPLPPGGRTTFSQALDDPPSGTTDIVPVVE